MGPDSAGGRVVSDTELFPFPKKEKFSTFIPYQGLKTPDIVTNVLFFSVLATTGIFTPERLPERPAEHLARTPPKRSPGRTPRTGYHH
ncbi:MAG: hypothetical protein ACPG7D_09010, partial [Candidatus Puniceispirillaceae bacterium]